MPGTENIAVVGHGPGDLRVENIATPTPGPGQVVVAVAYGGICGSDLHYYHRGGVGDFRITEPMVLGHEVVGTVLTWGPDVPEGTPTPGSPVAVHPATVCGHCHECLAGRANICRNVAYLGSAARTPHVQGGFSRQMVIPAVQLRALPGSLDLRTAALIEPLSVAVHAVSRAGDVRGKNVLVTGAGPIGCLVVAVLKQAGAARVTVSDMVDETLQIATAVGADAVVRADQPNGPDWPEDVELAIEASGAPPALATCLSRTRRGGTVVLLGLLPPGEVPFLGNVAVTRELDVRGAFRFSTEFDEAIALLSAGLQVAPIITGVHPVSQAIAAFDLAGDRRHSSKVLIDFTTDRSTDHSTVPATERSAEQSG
jgi:L-idonate 5-dehydrogenase